VDLELLVDVTHVKRDGVDAHPHFDPRGSVWHCHSAADTKAIEDLLRFSECARCGFPLKNLGAETNRNCPAYCLTPANLTATLWNICIFRKPCLVPPLP
jgi:hypothetical protein